MPKIDLLYTKYLSRGYKYLLKVCWGIKLIHGNKQNFPKAAWPLQYIKKKNNTEVWDEMKNVGKLTQIQDVIAYRIWS